jgi:hypothetical protein
VYGTLAGEKIRRALHPGKPHPDLIRGWEASGQIGVVKPEVPTIKEAVSKFLHDLEHGQRRTAATLSKHKDLLEERLLPWCEDRGYRLLKQFDVTAVREFRSGRPDFPITAQKNLERLRAFFCFCHSANWVKVNPGSGGEAAEDRQAVRTSEGVHRRADQEDLSRRATGIRSAIRSDTIIRRGFAHSYAHSGIRGSESAIVSGSARST